MSQRTSQRTSQNASQNTPHSKSAGPRLYSGLETDLYQLTMAAGYVQSGLSARASFELFVRSLPEQRNYLVAAGLDQALDFLENLSFSEAEIAYLRGLPLFAHLQPGFFEQLARLRFTGEVWALPEGTIFFPGEPMLRVTAPIVEAQLVETGLLSILHLQTLVASKAARITTAAAGRPVIEFGSRRAHGIEAAVLAARAAFIGGCQGSSNTCAGFRFGIPVFGTQAHSWIMAHREEAAAFEHFLDVFPRGAILLVDTYDVRAAIESLIAHGRKPSGIRLDSGDLLADSLWARQRLNRAGWNEVQIFVSGDLDERRIEALLGEGAAIDSFGVGTSLSTSSDVPAIGVVYKLVEIATGDEVRSTAKFSEEKTSYPGRKQIFRFSELEGSYCGDVIGLEEERFSESESLLVPVLREGRRLAEGPCPAEKSPAETVLAARQRFLEGRRRLPLPLLELGQAEPPYPVRYSSRLEALCESLRRDSLRRSFLAGSRRPAVYSAERGVVFWQVDVQADFMLPGGRLYVPGAEKLIPNIGRLVEAARQGGIPLVASADAHSLTDAEFRQWPPHCVQGTPGADLIPQGHLARCLVIPNDETFALPEALGGWQQVLLQKNTLDVFDNPNTDRLLERLRPGLGTAPGAAPLEFVLFGVVTEHCVRLAVEGLLRRGFRVALVGDAIAALAAEEGQRVLNVLQERGARLITTDEALELAAPTLAHPP